MCVCHGNPVQQHYLVNAGIFSRATVNLAVAPVGVECQQGKAISMQRPLERRGLEDAQENKKPAAPFASTKAGEKSQRQLSPGAIANILPVDLKTRGQRPELEETQEQLIAVARGGVRYAGKVFHRRGIKLTQDSPRSMLPHDVSLQQQWSIFVVVKLCQSWLVVAYAPGPFDCSECEIQR